MKIGYLYNSKFLIAGTSGVDKSKENDQWLLQNSDNLSMNLVRAPLTRANYLLWSRSMLIAFMPEEDLSKHEEWIKADNIVTSWILNSIAKEIVNVVLYASNAKELWEEILSNSKSFEMKWHALGHSLIATVEL
uniref:Retrotransposon Copia-like N-terminal domain-containing protein n=1 Tax=Manihot esculenta TaxID=3983 RepID=A0A2C9V087_MANES